MKTSTYLPRMLAAALAVALIVVAVPEAHATTATNNTDFQAPFLNLLTSILNVFNGGLARMLAVLAIIGLGLSAMVGRLTWGLAIRVVVGIVLVFGAAAIVGLITGTSGNTSFSLGVPAAAAVLA